MTSPLIFGETNPPILSTHTDETDPRTTPVSPVPKKLTEDVDFSPQIRSIISRTYSESPNTYSEELSLLNRSRQDALRGAAGSDVTARDLLYKYFGQLELLELRFPDLKVPFPWSDAFTQTKISQLSLAYEKASVIFNIGATLSSLGSSSPRSSPEGIKRAFHAFRCASGMFTYINDNFLHAPSTDLSKEIIKILVGLMNAQATEVFMDTMPAGVAKSPGLKSKICAQVAGLYNGIVEETKEAVVKAVLIKEWSHLIQAKAKYFGSLAQYYRSVADATSSKYGDSLARIIIAETLAKEAHKLSLTFSSTFSTTTTPTSLSPDAPSAMVELTKTHLSLMSEMRAKAQRDNDLIYNAVIPTEASLSPLEPGKMVAEPIAIHDVYATAEVQKIIGPDLFVRLVPLSVTESASLYSEEKAKVARGEAERVDLAEGEWAAALEYMGLPGSLNRFGASAGAQDDLIDPGAQVRGWAEEIGNAQREGRVEELFKRLMGLKENVGKELENVGRELDVESRECEALRVKYGHLWDQSPSSSLTRSYRQDLRSHRESLEQASGSDSLAIRLWESVWGDVAILEDREGLKRAFVEVVGTGGKAQTGLLDDSDAGADEEEAQIKKRVESIRENLSKLNKIKKERVEVLKDLKERIHADDISHILILSRKGGPNVDQTLFATELEKFRPHQTRITATLQHQTTILNEVSADFKLLSEGKRAREIQGRWAEAEQNKSGLVARLGRARSGYFKAREGLIKGTQFYQDLAGLVDGLRQQVSSFVGSRNSERERMASTADVRQRLEGNGGGAGSQSPLEADFASLSFGNRSPGHPPPSESAAPSWNSAPPPPSSNPYYPPPPLPPHRSSYQGAIPNSGAFALPQPPNPYSSAPPPRPPPPPTQQPSYSSYTNNSPGGYSSPPLPPSNTYSPVPPSNPYNQPLPPPPQPQRQASQSYLPPPPVPVSYSSYSQQGPPPPQPGYVQQHQQAYGAPPPPPLGTNYYGAGGPQPPRPNQYGAPPPPPNPQAGGQQPPYQQQQQYARPSY